VNGTEPGSHGVQNRVEVDSESVLRPIAEH
jgi:hypothetical protein